MNSPVLAFSGLLYELQQQVTDLLRLFLLHPMAGAFDEMTTDHARARDCLHRFSPRANSETRRPLLPSKYYFMIVSYDSLERRMFPGVAVATYDAQHGHG
jgi:hypothetical protein